MTVTHATWPCPIMPLYACWCAARWLYRRQDVGGYEADVHILKNKLAKPGGEARIAITFDGTVRGDGA